MYARPLMVAAVAVIAVATMGASSCDVSGGNTVNQPSSLASSSASASASAAAPAAHVGATLSLNGNSGEKLQVTLVKVVDPSTPANQYESAAAGNRYVAVELRYKNVGSATYQESILTDLTLLDAASHSYSTDLAGDTTAGPGFPSDLVNIGPGESADGFVVVQVPTGTPVVKAKLASSFFGGDTGEWLIP